MRREIAQLLKYIRLHHRPQIITIYGIGGVGKTALVLQAAHLSYRNSCLGESSSSNGSGKQAMIFALTLLIQIKLYRIVSLLIQDSNIPVFEAFIFVSAMERVLRPTGIPDTITGKFQKTLGDIYRIIANTLDDQSITRASQEEQLEKVYKILEKQKTLLIIDNMETVDNEDDVIDFLSNLPKNTTPVITTRNWKGTYPCINLRCLTEKNSLKLIEQQVEEKKSQTNMFLQPPSKENIKPLYDRFGEVPLALIYAVGRWALGYSLEAILERSTQLPEHIVRFVFERSLDQLRGQAAHKLLMSIGMFSSSPKRDALVKVAGFNSYRDVEDHIVKLMRLSLIYKKQDKRYERYEMLPLTREFVLDELRTNNDFQQEAQERLVSLYVKFAEDNGGRDWKNWVVKRQNIESEFTNLLAVMDWCADEHDRYQDFKRLCESLLHYASLHGHWDLRLKWLKFLIQKANRLRDSNTAINAMSEDSYTLIMMGGEAKLKEAEDCLLAASSECSSADFRNRRNQLSLHKQMAILRIHQQRYEDAKQELNQVEELISQIRFSRRNRIRSEISLDYYRAEIEFTTDNYEQAKNLYLQVVEKEQEIGWPRRRIDAQTRLNEITIKQNAPDNLGKVQESLASILYEAESNQYKLGIANCQAALASFYSKVEKHDKACSWASKARDDYERLGMNQQEEEMISLYKYCAIPMSEENNRVS